MCHLFHANVSSGPWRSSFVRPSPTLNMSVGTTDPLHGSISSTRLSANNKREYNFVRIFRSKLNYSKRETGFGNLIINYSSRGGCENVPEQKCKSVPRQQCQQVPNQVCENVPRPRWEALQDQTKRRRQPKLVSLSCTLRSRDRVWIPFMQ